MEIECQKIESVARTAETKRGSQVQNVSLLNFTDGFEDQCERWTEYYSSSVYHQDDSGI
ncbi:hypothetical protein BDV18DRAFT_148051 [Aspergillus unguis]